MKKKKNKIKYIHSLSIETWLPNQEPIQEFIINGNKSIVFMAKRLMKQEIRKRIKSGEYDKNLQYQFIEQTFNVNGLINDINE